ncbi:MAG: RNA polymerase sigma factor [Ilumatobacteraceae bacterium]
MVAAHLGGNPGALAVIYDRYADSLHDTARAMLSDAHDAEDMTHDVFVIASQRLDQLRDPDRLRPWLFAVLRNEVYKRSKRRTRVRPTDLDGVAELEAPIDPYAEGADVERA